MRSGLMRIYRDPVWLSLAVCRIGLNFRHAPEWTLAIIALTGLGRGWWIARREIPR